jgi:pyruvate,orthophosphate dikinase
MKALLAARAPTSPRWPSRHPGPARFTITTEMCIEYYKVGGSRGLEAAVKESVAWLEQRRASSSAAPTTLAVSVRSARARRCPHDGHHPQPRLNDTTVGAGPPPENPRFAYDAYRRLLTMYANVVMERTTASSTAP